MQFTMEKPAIGDEILEEQTEEGHHWVRVTRCSGRTAQGQILTLTGGRYDMTGTSVNANFTDNRRYMWRMIEDNPANRDRIERQSLLRFMQMQFFETRTTEQLRRIVTILKEA